MHAPVVTVGQINSPAAARCSGSGWAEYVHHQNEPTAAPYRMQLRTNINVFSEKRIFDDALCGRIIRIRCLNYLKRKKIILFLPKIHV